MIKAVILDVGGTLVKTDQAILKALERALRENGILFKDKEKVINVFGGGNFLNIKTAVECSYNGEMIEEKINLCYNSYKKIFPRKVMGSFAVIKLVPESLQHLQEKGMKLAALTGFDRAETDFFFQSLGLRKYFDLVLSAEDIQEHRPNPRGLLVAMEKLELEKEECLYVGDTMVDIEFARNAGVKVACVKTGAQKKELLQQRNPDFFLSSLAELKIILKNETKGYFKE